MADPFVLEFGGPFTGYVSAVQRELAPPGAFTGSSKDWIMDPVESRWLRRLGMTNVGGKSGILEVAYDTAPPAGEPNIQMRAVDAIPFHMRTMDITGAGAPDTYAFLYVEDRPAAPNANGQIYYRFEPASGSADNKNRVVGGDFTTTAQLYPKYQKYFPEIGGGRFVDKYQRATAAAGSRKIIEVGDYIYAPTFGVGLAGATGSGIPHKWNKQRYYGTIAFNERIQWTGHVPPLRGPTITIPGVGGVADLSPTNINVAGTWRAGVMFFLGVMFRRKDGSWSSPTQIRAPNAIQAASGSGTSRVAGGFGLQLLNVAARVTNGIADATNPHYRQIQYNGIPTGPDGTTARALVRSGQVDGGLAGALPDISQLGIIDIIEDNTTTTYIDTQGDDGALVFDDNLVRYDQIMQPRARYIGAFDQRLAVANCRANPMAIFLAPRLTGTGVLATNNDAQTAAAPYIPDDNGSLSSFLSEGGPGAYRFYFESVVGAGATTSYLRFYRWDGTNPVSHTASAYRFDTYPTIQQMVDAINADASLGAGQWNAAVVPGANPQATCFGALQATGTFALSADGYYGDKFTQSGATLDLQRCYSNAWPGVIMFKASYLATIPEDPRGLYFTGGGPAHAANAADSYYFGGTNSNYRQSPPEAGEIMGVVGILDGAIVPCRYGVCIMRNQKGGKSGEDQDYRLELVQGLNGCISDRSVASVRGCAIWLSPQGLEAYDGHDYQLLSGPGTCYSPAGRIGERGEWETEIGMCIGAQASGNRDEQQFSVSLVGSKLVVSYRITLTENRGDPVGDNFADREMEYDFSASSSRSGVAALLRDDGTPFGWSCPVTRRLGACTAIGGAAGERHFGAYDALQDATSSALSSSGTLSTNTLTATTPGAYSVVVVGSTVSGSASIPGGTTVTAVAGNGNTLTLSASIVTVTITNVVLSFTAVTGGRIDEFDVGTYDVDATTTGSATTSTAPIAVASSAGSGSPTLTADTPGGYASILVGSIVAGHANILSGSIIIAKAANGNTMTMNFATTGPIPTTTSLTFSSSTLTTTSTSTGFSSVAVGAVAVIGTHSYAVASKQQDVQIAVVSTAASGSATLTADVPSGFSRIQVGALVVATGIAIGTTVLSKATDNSSLTMSVPTTAAITSASIAFRGTIKLTAGIQAGDGATGTVTFTGKEVEPVGFSRTAVLDPMFRKKHRPRILTLKYLKDTTGITVAYARLLAASRTNDTKWVVMRPPATGTPFGSFTPVLPQSARAPGQCSEVRFADDGSGATQPAVYKATVEGTLLDTWA